MGQVIKITCSKLSLPGIGWQADLPPNTAPPTIAPSLGFDEPNHIDECVFRVFSHIESSAWNRCLAINFAGRATLHKIIANTLTPIATQPLLSLGLK